MDTEGIADDIAQYRIKKQRFGLDEEDLAVLTMMLQSLDCIPFNSQVEKLQNMIMELFAPAEQYSFNPNPYHQECVPEKIPEKKSDAKIPPFLRQAKKIYKEYSAEFPLEKVYHFLCFFNGDVQSVMDCVFNPNSRIGKSAQLEECLVCFENDKYLYPLDCSHKFCFDCLRQQIGLDLQNSTLSKCSTCNQSIKAEDCFYLNPELHDKYAMLMSQSLVRNDKANVFVSCPNCPNQQFLVPKNRRCAQCPDCKHEFCTECSELFHTYENCDAAKHLRGEWITWLHKNNRDHLNLNQKLAQLQQDENWKQSNARHCPNCNRIIVRTAGCDHMKCGAAERSEDGRPIPGCGKDFSWAQAKPYVADVSHFQQSVAKLNTNHLINCSVCQQTIVGLRFKCINCHSFDLCQNCEASRNNHNAKHSFKILDTIENVEDIPDEVLFNSLTFNDSPEHPDYYNDFY